MTGASTSNYIAAERGSKPRRPPLIPSTPAPERLTPTGLTTSPSGGRKKFRARGTQWPSSTITAPCYRSSRCCGTTQGGHLRRQGRPDSPGSPLSKLTRPDSVPRRGGRGGVNPRRPRSGAELWHLPLSQAGPKADRRLRRACLLGLCAPPSTGLCRSLLALPSTPFHFCLAAAAA